jgi:hypothetical protein
LDPLSTGRFWWTYHDVLAQRRRIERPTPAQCPGERPASFGEFETTQVRMQRSTSAGQPVARIGDDAPDVVDLGRDHSQQD